VRRPGIQGRRILRTDSGQYPLTDATRGVACVQRANFRHELGTVLTDATTDWGRHLSIELPMLTRSPPDWI
jgi:hypothetical protein